MSQNEFSDRLENDGNGETRAGKVEQRVDRSEEDGRETLHVVGIGASAGSLKGLRSFFEEFSSGTHTAFVVVVHLSPDRESRLDEILDAKSALHVQQVTGRTRMEADHVYIVPPGKNIKITDGHLATTSFSDPRWRRTPIDNFFRTLAYNHPDGIGILFSGGGSDGTRGMKAIKEQGGLLMVQDPEEADYKSMLQSAIDTGEIDFVLPVKDLAKKVVELTKTADLYQLVPEPESLPESEESVLQAILAHLDERVGHDFSGYKRSTVLRRLQRRMRVNMVDSLSMYLGYLKGHEGEANKLFADLLISVTGFFRDPEAWEALQPKIIPQLFKDKHPGDEVRAWVPGCATGEEAYSLAMLLLEYADSLENSPSIQVFACDLDKDAIETARKGTYPQTISADLSSENLSRFFHKRDNQYQVSKRLRDIILFAPHNLLKDPPFSRQDLIACRNLLIYLQRNLQKKVLGVFHYALNQGGVSIPG